MIEDELDDDGVIDAGDDLDRTATDLPYERADTFVRGCILKMFLYRRSVQE